MVSQMSSGVLCSLSLAICGAVLLLPYFDRGRGRLPSIALLAMVLTNATAGAVMLTTRVSERGIFDLAMAVTCAMLALIAAATIHDFWWRQPGRAR